LRSASQKAFHEELQIRVWLFGLMKTMQERLTAGDSPRDSIRAALTACMGKPPARSKQKRRFIGLMLEHGLPGEFAEPYLRPHLKH